MATECAACLTATTACSLCIKMLLSEPLRARFCGKACQESSWVHGHKRWHSVFKNAKGEEFGSNENASGLVQTTCLALLELKAIGGLPHLDASSGASILYAGASTRHEEFLEADRLFSILKEFVYPDLANLAVYLCGPELHSTTQPQALLPNITVTATKSTIEAKFSTPASLSGFQLCVIAAPGYTDFLDRWDPAMTLLVESGIPLAVTSYSSLHALDNDALFDQDCLEKYWRANVVVGTQINSCFSTVYLRGLGHKSRYYTVVQGRNAGAAVVSKKEYKRGMTANYLRFQANFYRAQDSHFATQCEKIAAQLDAGTFPYAEQKMSYFINLAR